MFWNARCSVSIGIVLLAACSWILAVLSRSSLPVESMIPAVVSLSEVICCSTSRWLVIAWATVTAVRSAPTVVVLARSTPLTSSTFLLDQVEREVALHGDRHLRQQVLGA